MPTVSAPPPLTVMPPPREVMVVAPIVPPVPVSVTLPDESTDVRFVAPPLLLRIVVAARSVCSVPAVRVATPPVPAVSAMP